MNITKAKVTKDNTLVATYTDETGTVTVEGKNLVTNDLINAFKALVPHMAFLCEQKEADVQADEIPEAQTEAPANPDIEAFQKIMDNSKVTIEVNGKQIKPRRSHRSKTTQLAS